MIKINIFKSSHGFNKIHVSYPFLQKRKKTKVFNVDAQQEALDYALGVQHNYIDYFDDGLLDWAKQNNHPILKRKFIF